MKVCDFGLAQTRTTTTQLTQSTHALRCTLQWTAPEILLMDDHINKGDIYSLGVVYWELAATEIPYDGHQNATIREFVLAGDRLEIPESVPRDFAALINKCWTGDPKNRPSCSVVIQSIEKCIQNQSNFIDFIVISNNGMS